MKNQLTLLLFISQKTVYCVNQIIPREGIHPSTQLIVTSAYVN